MSSLNTHTLHLSIDILQHKGAHNFIHVPAFLKMQYIWGDKSGNYQNMTCLNTGLGATVSKLGNRCLHLVMERLGSLPPISQVFTHLEVRFQYTGIGSHEVLGTRLACSEVTKKLFFRNCIEYDK